MSNESLPRDVTPIRPDSTTRASHEFPETCGASSDYVVIVGARPVPVQCARLKGHTDEHLGVYCGDPVAWKDRPAPSTQFATTAAPAGDPAFSALVEAFGNAVSDFASGESSAEAPEVPIIEARRALESRHAAVVRERDEGRRVHLARHLRLSEAVGSNPNFSCDFTVDSAIAKLATVATLEAQRAALAEDAGRWRALVGCQRVRHLGNARLGQPDQHIGFELWEQFPAADVPPGANEGSIADLTRFADAAAARAALAPPGGAHAS